jgi:hypothetical protein
MNDGLVAPAYHSLDVPFYPNEKKFVLDLVDL